MGNTTNNTITNTNSLNNVIEDYSSDHKERVIISREHFLRELDGINSSNIHLIYENFGNLLEFISAPKSKLRQIFGSEVGNLLYDNFNINY